MELDDGKKLSSKRYTNIVTKQKQKKTSRNRQTESNQANYTLCMFNVATSFLIWYLMRYSPIYLLYNRVRVCVLRYLHASGINGRLCRIDGRIFCVRFSGNL